MKKFLSKMKNEEGQALLEYGLLVALIAVICIGAITSLGTKINTALGAIVTAL
jgi:pilus assembly protein Flp/PilA